MVPGDRRQDAAPFMRVVETMTAGEAPLAVVSGSIEYFNPAARSCCVVAHVAASRINARGGRVHISDYPIERRRTANRVNGSRSNGARAPRASTRTIANYDELKREIERRSVGMNLDDLGRETLHPARCRDMWPQQLGFEPLYEKYGRMRVSSGVYRDVITYADHVRPLAMRLLDRS